MSSVNGMKEFTLLAVMCIGIGYSALLAALIYNINACAVPPKPVIQINDKCFTRSTQGDQQMYHPIKCPWEEK